MEYQKLCEGILSNVGGKENIVECKHCMTRLRMVFADNEKVNVDALKKIDGLKGVNISGVQYQLIVGPNVPAVYEDLLKVAGIQVGDDGRVTSAAAEKPKAAAKRKPIDAAADILSGIFMPIMPAILTGGIIKGLLMLLATLGVLDNTGTTYMIMYHSADSVFYFLPFLIAYSGSRKLNTNAAISLAIAASLLTPNLVQLLASGEAVTLLGIPVYAAKYNSSVLPMILALIAQMYLERGLKKVLPRGMQGVFVPALTFLVLLPLTYLALGPAGGFAGTILASGFQTVYNFSPIICGLLIGGLWQALTLTGMHWAFVTIMTNNLAVFGYEIIVGMNSPSCWAQQGACLGTMLKAKDPDIKKNCAAILSAAMLAGGTMTEPTMFGNNLRFKTPFLCGLLGGAVGGAIAGATGVTASAIGNINFYNFAIFLGPAFLFEVLACVAAFVIACAATYFAGIDESL